MNLYLENLSNDAVIDIVIPKVRTLLSPNGKIRRLNAEEVSGLLTRDDKCHKAVMQAKTKAIGGDPGCVHSFLETAMSWQGRVDVETPSKKQMKMSTQLVEVYWTAQQLAKSGVRTNELQTEEK